MLRINDDTTKPLDMEHMEIKTFFVCRWARVLQKIKNEGCLVAALAEIDTGIENYLLQQTKLLLEG